MTPEEQQLFDGRAERLDDYRNQVINLRDRVAELESQLKRAQDILFCSTDNEITSDPWWAVVRKNRLGSSAISAGPFFSRERAETHMEARRHEYGKGAFVFCFSGYYSRHYRDLREALKPKEYPQ